MVNLLCAARLLGAYSRLFSRRRVCLDRVRSCRLKKASSVSGLFFRAVGHQNVLICFERRFVFDDAIFGNAHALKSPVPITVIPPVITAPSSAPRIPRRAAPQPRPVRYPEWQRTQRPEATPMRCLRMRRACSLLHAVAMCACYKNGDDCILFTLGVPDTSLSPGDQTSCLGQRHPPLAGLEFGSHTGAQPVPDIGSRQKLHTLLA